MAWSIDFLPAADRELRKLEPQAARRVLSFLAERVAPSKDPRKLGEALKGSRLGEFWKYRVGDFRIIAKIEDSVLRILVIRVANRRDAYR